MNGISISGLTQVIKNRKILDNINLNINKGEIIAILGENGSGKSTLLKNICGILSPTRGKITVDNINLEDIINTNKEILFRRKTLSYIGQYAPNQIVGYTVEDDLAFGLENKCYDRNKIVEIIDKILTYMNVSKLKKKLVSELSGGEKQLCAIMSSLVMNTEYYLFDEPTAQLDGRLKEKVIEYIVNLKRKNKGIVIVTHDLSEILIATKIILISNGKIEYISETKEFLQNISVILEHKLKLPSIIEYSNIFVRENLIKNNVFTYKELVNELWK